jgi:hypothetical protein
VEEVMLPFPWSSKAKIATLSLGGELYVVLGEFHAQVLGPEGPMPTSLDVLRGRLIKATGPQLVVDLNNEPIALAMLKEKGVVAARVARVKLVGLGTMESVMLGVACRADHVATIINTYKNITIPHKDPPAQAPTPSGPSTSTWPSSTSTSSLAAPSMTTQSAKRKPSGDEEEEPMVWEWPTTLPQLAWPPKSLTEDYGLHTILPQYQDDPSIPLGLEVVNFKAWCMEPMHLGRGMQYANPVKDITFEGAMDCVHGFMGFMFKVREGVPFKMWGYITVITYHICVTS